MNTPFVHVPVMPDEVLKLLAPKPGQDFIDGTLGGGGHAEKILEATAPNGRLLALDLDPEALKAASERLKSFGDGAVFVQGNYREVDTYAKKHGFESVDGALLDLGVSSHEFDTAERGFSFRKEGPLDMRFSSDQEFTAATIVNSWLPEKLEEIFREYGEEKFAKRIAEAIVRQRTEERITTTTQLEKIIWGAVPAEARHGKIHPATRVFQALRIAVNDELGALSEALPKLVKRLKVGGRIAVISFHSLEDRIVKQFFVEEEKAGRLQRLTKKPVTPTDAEVTQNPRARSAKLRVAERVKREG